MATSTVEDYLKAILLHEQTTAHDTLVGMGKIASTMGVAPGTVTAMVKTLEKRQHVTYAPYSGVRLTDQGRALALHVLRRHRLVELFLVEVLGLDWSEVHDEAEQLEHTISDKLLDRIDALLGYPTSDPHGDPIPDAQGEFRTAPLVHLAACVPGTRAQIARVSDQREAFLRFVEERGLKPGAMIEVVSDERAAETVVVRCVDGRETTLGREAAAKLWISALVAGPDSLVKEPS